MKRIVQSKSGKQNQTPQLLIEAALQLIRNRLCQEQRTFVELFAGTGNLTMAILEHCIHFDQLELQEIDQRRLNSLHIRFSAYPTVSITKRDSYRIKTRWEPNTVYFADPPYTPDAKHLPQTEQYKLLASASSFHWHSGFFMMQCSRVFGHEAKKSLPEIKLFEYGNNCLCIIEKDLSIKE